MTDLEDRLRRDLTTLAERVAAAGYPRSAAAAASAGAARGALAGPGRRGSRGRRRGHHRGAGRHRPWLPGRPRRYREQHHQSAGADHRAGSRLAQFYVVVYNTFVGSKIPTIAAVHDSVTGKTLTRVQVPTLYSNGGADGPGISAAADDRTYVITEIGDGANRTVWFFLVRVAADGRSATVRKLPITWPKDAVGRRRGYLTRRHQARGGRTGLRAVAGASTPASG